MLVAHELNEFTLVLDSTNTTVTWPKAAPTTYFVENPNRDWAAGDTDRYSYITGYYGTAYEPIYAYRPFDWSYTWDSAKNFMSSTVPNIGFAMLRYKSSIGSQKVNPSDLRGLTEMLISSNPSFRRPKKPVYFPLKFYGRRPLFREVADNAIPEPKRPPKISDRRWNRLLMRWLARREVLIEKINRSRYVRYLNKVSAYNQRRANFERRSAEHLRIFQARQRRYLEKLDRLEARARRTAIKYVRTRLVSTFTEWKPFTSIVLSLRDKKPDFLLRRVPTQNVDMQLYDRRSPWSKFTDQKGWVNACWRPVSPSSITDRERQLLVAGIRDLLLDAVLSSKLYEEELSQKLLRKIADSKVHIGNLIAERHQTASLIKDSFLKLKDLFLAKKKILKSLSSAFSDKKQLAAFILQWKFGVEPLAKDIVEAIQYFKEELKFPPIVTSRASITRELEDYDFGGFKFTGLIRVSMVSQHRMDCDYDRFTSQFGLNDISQTVWEVTPWSFVVDWLIPIGDWLTRLSAERGLTFTRAVRSYKLYGKFTLPENRSMTDDSSIQLTLAGEWEGVLKFREVLDQLPNGMNLFIKNPWSMSHFFESIALGLQRLRN